MRRRRFIGCIRGRREKHTHAYNIFTRIRRIVGRSMGRCLRPDILAYPFPFRCSHFRVGFFLLKHFKRHACIESSKRRACCLGDFGHGPVLRINKVIYGTGKELYCIRENEARTDKKCPTFASLIFIAS